MVTEKQTFRHLRFQGNLPIQLFHSHPYTHTIANAVHDSDREVMAHIPMEAIHNNHLLGKGALKLAMTEQQTRQQVQEILKEIPLCQRHQ